MMKITPTKCLSIMILFILLSMLTNSALNNAFAQRTKTSQGAGEQRKAEYGLKDNEKFFYYINFSVSNEPIAKERELCRKAILFDMFARFLYMKFRFRDSYLQIRKAQELLVELYAMVLMREIEDGKKLLDTVSPGPIMKNNYTSKRYCSLGYRSNEEARIYKVMADNYRSTLYSMRLYKYIQALKKAKLAKRYALLAYVTYTSSKEKKKLQVIKLDAETYTYSLLKVNIESIVDQNERMYMMRVLDDSYYKLNNNYSYYDDVWSNGSLQELPEYKEYAEKED